MNFSLPTYLGNRLFHWIVPILLCLSVFDMEAYDLQQGDIAHKDGFTLQAKNYYTYVGTTTATYTVGWEIIGIPEIPSDQKIINIPNYHYGAYVKSAAEGVLDFPGIEQLNIVAGSLDKLQPGAFNKMKSLNRFYVSGSNDRNKWYFINTDCPEFLFKYTDSKKQIDGSSRHINPVLFAMAPGKAKGDVVVNSKLDYFSIYPIGYGAFDECSEMTSLNVYISPAFYDENRIEAVRFKGCTKLANFYADAKNTRLKAKDGYLTSLAGDSIIAFPPSSRDKHAIDPEIRVLASHAFNSCSINELTVGPSVSKIDQWVFNNFTGNITILSDIAEIDENAFTGMNETGTITCPPTLAEKIKINFHGTVNELPCYISEWDSHVNSITFKIGTKENVILKSVRMDDKPLSLSDKGYHASGLTPNKEHIITCTYSSDGKDETLSFRFTPSSPFGQNVEGHEITSEIFEGGFDINLNLKNINDADQIDEIGVYDMDSERYYSSKTITKREKSIAGSLAIRELIPGQEYRFKVFAGIGGCRILDERFVQQLKTKLPVLDLSYTATQTTITIDKHQLVADGTAEYDGVGLSLNFWMSNPDIIDLTEEPYIQTGLYPMSNVTFYRLVKFNGNWINIGDISIKTKQARLSMTPETSPTAVTLTLVNECGDAPVWGITLVVPGRDPIQLSLSSDEMPLAISGLEPDCDYTMYLKYNFGEKEGEGIPASTETIKFKTNSLNLTTLKPDCVNDHEAIVSAETNIADLEKNAGFQWKKYDAPESLEPNEATAFVRNGMIKGVISNLQSSSYYNVRAFYKSDSEKYYYGDWVTFDPSDFSFFEPTFDVYKDPVTTEEGVILYAYVMRGSDEITEQGFEYWKTDGSASRRLQAPNSTGKTERVRGSGNYMTVELKSFESNGVYEARPYAITSNGEYFGSSVTFEIETSGVNLIHADQDKKIVGYYNINGVRVGALQQGINFILYEDGSVKKVFRQ